MASYKEFLAQGGEKKWQDQWLNTKIDRADDFSDKPKKYVLDMFPYPSGAGLHVGHPEGYTATDIYSRYLRLKGFNVLHPMGWDAFGLPAENYAIKTGTHPRVTTEANIATFKRQIQSLGFSYDWDREVDTTDPKYYKWTQWIFLQLFKKGLAYEATVPINWCPSCLTGLANEEVKDGKCDRCGTQVEKKDLRQWMLKITAYADRLLEGVDKLDWPSSIKTLQKNWIGRSEGINFKQKIKGMDIEFEVYDSIPQTFLAQTFTVIAPEHPLVEKLVAGTEYEKPVKEFVKKIEERKLANKFDLEKEMEGIFTGRYVENPFGTGDLPLWIASYVIADYGTGIVNCSAHDERDFAFAKKYGIPMQVALLPEDAELAEKVKNLEVFYREPDGIMQSPEEVRGMKWYEAREPVIEYIEKHDLGRRAVQYKLRDWVFSRQRYWGEPIPLVHCAKCGIVPLDEKDLPLTLPEVDKYEPTGTGESPLATIDEWVNTTCPKCGGSAKRETNTMPQWAGSSWYWLRYIDPHNDNAIADAEKMKYWLPVDLYLGGAEHAVLHLLYARFWNMVLFDLGVVPQEEPFTKLINQGLILGEDGEKMSKSRGNVVNPDDILKEYGADTFRMYEMFMGPLEDMKPWSTKNILGVHRFLYKVWEMSSRPIFVDSDGLQEIKIALDKTIKKVGEDIENMSYNTATSTMMILINFINNVGSQKKKHLNDIISHKNENGSEDPLSVEVRDLKEKFLIILSPFAPHMCEELWSQLGHTESIFKEKWPEYDPAKVIDSEIEMPVQVNGKIRAKLKLPADVSEDDAKQMALADENVKKYVAGEPKKVIVIKGKLISIVA